MMAAHLPWAEVCARPFSSFRKPLFHVSASPPITWDLLPERPSQGPLLPPMASQSTLLKVRNTARFHQVGLSPTAMSLNPPETLSPNLLCLWGPGRELFLVSLLFPKMNKCESQVGVCLVKIYLEVLLLVCVTHPVYLGRMPASSFCSTHSPHPLEKADMWQEALARGWVSPFEGTTCLAPQSCLMLVHPLDKPFRESWP